MDKEKVISEINSKFEELKTALEGDDLLKIRELTSGGKMSIGLHVVKTTVGISEE